MIGNRPLRTWVPVGFGLLMTVAACAGPHTARVEVLAAEMRDSVAATVVDWNTSHRAGHSRTASLQDLRSTLADSPDVVVSAVRDDGVTQTLDVAFHRRAETGGGLAAEVSVLRMCVTYRLPHNETQLKVGGATCAADLPTHIGLGTVTTVVDFEE